MESESRHDPRNRILKGGSICFEGGAIDCTVRNISKTGAALDVASPLGIPHEFVLMVPADKLSQRCRVVWRKETRIGVAFDLD